MTNYPKNWIEYWQLVQKHRILSIGRLRIVKNLYNLGFWIVKDSQKRITLNLGKIRLQF